MLAMTAGALRADAVPNLRRRVADHYHRIAERRLGVHVLAVLRIDVKEASA